MGDSLASIRQWLASRQGRTSYIEAATNQLSIDGDGRLTFDGQAFTLSEYARAELARMAGIPREFFDRCPSDLQAYLFNRLYPEFIGTSPSGPITLLIMQGDSHVEGIADPELALLGADEVLETALSACPDSIDEGQLKVVNFRMNGEMRISIVSSQVQTEPRVGDIVRAGLDIRHSSFGRFGTQIESFFLRLACRNGMLSKVCQHESNAISRIRRAAAQNRDRTIDRVEQMARMAWNELDSKMKAINLLAEQPVDNTAALIRSIGEKLRFTERLINQIIAAIEADEIEPSGTLWDIVGAFSRIGTHADRLSPATRRYLQELSGDLIGERVESCPTCGGIRRGRMRYLPRR